MIVEEANLAQTISVLRRALGENSRVHEYIATIPGRGYQFVAAVEIAGPERADPADASRTGARYVGSPRFAYGLLALVAVAVALSAGLSLFNPRAARETETSAVLRNSVAVLPFQNLSPEPDDASLVLGIHQEIISQLASIRELNVIPRSSVLRYADGQTSTPEIAAELRVEAIVQGSLSYAGDRIGVMVELIDGDTGTLIWSEDYDGDLLDVVAIQADLASAIVAALEVELLPAERNRIETRPTENLAAYEFYLRAADAGSAGEGVAYLDRAIAIDPEFAVALGLKATNLSCLLINAQFAAPVSADASVAIEQLVLSSRPRRCDWMPMSVRRGSRAGTFISFTGAGRKPERLTRERLRSAAKMRITLTPYVRFNIFMGNHEAAAEVAQQVRGVDPTDTDAPWLQGWALGSLGRHDESLTAYRDALRLDPTSILFRLELLGTPPFSSDVIARRRKRIARPSNCWKVIRAGRVASGSCLWLRHVGAARRRLAPGQAI